VAPSGESVHVPDASQLDLRVESQPQNVRLSWNRKAPAVTEATSGLLTVSDGDYRIEVTLDRKELLSGSLAYIPITDNVAMQLDVTTTRGSKSSESVRILAPASLASSGPSKVPAKTPIVTDDNLDEAEADRAVESVKRVLATRTFRPPQEQPRLLAVSNLPAPPQLQAQITGTPAMLNLPGGQPVRPPQPAPQRPRASDAQPQALSTAPPAASRPGVVQSSYSPPVPTRQVYPPVPEVLRRTFIYSSMGVIEIAVRASINSDGRVTTAVAEPSENNTSVVAYLAKVATDAARRWRFRPASLNGKVIASEMVLRFRFTNR
jgi:protein TonB